MRRELGIARCGLACCLCSENRDCTGCDDGCADRAACVNRLCSVEKGLQSCGDCRESCEKGMMARSRNRAFLAFREQYGEEKLMDALERNEKAGILYHRNGLLGDYDAAGTEETIFALLERGMRE